MNGRSRASLGRPVQQWLVLLVVGGIGFVTGCSGDRVVDQPLELVAGASTSSELAPHTARRYLFELVAGEFVELGVEAETGTGVEVALTSPDGEVLFEDDAQVGGGTLLVVAVARHAGQHALRVRAVDQEQEASFRVRVACHRSARVRDRRRWEALADLAKAERSRREGRRAEAVQNYRAALSVPGGLPPSKRARASWRLGEILSAEDRPVEAIELLEQARSWFAEASDSLGEARVLLDLGDAYFAVGRLGKAEAVYGRALELYRKIGVKSGEATAVHDLGLVASTYGDAEAAVTRFREALGLWRELGLPAAESVTLQTLGSLYSRIGRDAEAISYLERALSQIDPEDAHARGVALLELGWSHHLRGDEEEALRRFGEALDLARKSEDRLGEAAVEDRRGTVLRATGRTEEARRAYRRSLAISRKAGARRGEAHTLTNLAWLCLDGETPGRAERMFEAAQEMLQELGDQEVGEAILTGLARVKRLRGDLEGARAELLRAVNQLEAHRSEVPGLLSRSYFVAVRYDAYEELATVLADLDRQRPGEGYAREALEVAEAARSRSLLESLASSSKAWKWDPRRRKLFEEIRRLEEGRVAPAETSAAAAEITEELQDRWLQLEQLEPEPPEIPAPVDVEGMQALLDGDSVLVVYLLAEPESFAWTVDRHSMELHWLAGAEVIGRAARRAFEALSSRAGGAAAFRTEVPLSQLSQLVLQPLEDRIEGRKRLVVLADGALHSVPFSALPGGASAEPLVTRMEVVSLPSMTVLARLRESRAGRRSASLMLAAVADPVLEADDDRLTGMHVETGTPRDLQRSLDELDLQPLRRLPAAGREAEAIAALVPDASRMLATGFAANRQLVVSGRLGDYRIVHFATHGLVNSVHPGLSGVVLSLYDRQGKPQQGFLRAAEIASLDLNAELVVLSACQTASGPEVRGEGMVSLVDAMFAAGAQRVVASLWRVNDAPTGKLMRELYEQLLVHGQSPGVALRKAQLSIRDAAAGPSSYDWAAFSLYGDWLPLPNMPASSGVGESRTDESGSTTTPGVAVEGTNRHAG